MQLDVEAFLVKAARAKVEVEQFLGLLVNSLEQVFLCMLRQRVLNFADLGWFLGPSGVFFGVFPEIQTEPRGDHVEMMGMGLTSSV
ncbi:MAG: hypothetical protein HRT36_07675 [Alphaproteobacteria bacterium]|nr:hypothetical protein [Alphaproteobacteria bacterium]